MKKAVQNAFAFLLTIVLGIGGGCALAAVDAVEEQFAKHRHSTRSLPRG
jgi:hypothetical protein